MFDEPGLRIRKCIPPC